MSPVLALSLAVSSGMVHGDDKGLFVGYELFEMTMNKFTNFTGEVGYRFDNNNILRLSMFEVKLTESAIMRPMQWINAVLL